jgi:SAM-dependent methyltransferase
MTWFSFLKRLRGGRRPYREGTPLLRREIPSPRSDHDSSGTTAWLEDDDDLAWLNPPNTMRDPSAWDRYWNDQISHGLNPQLFDLFVTDDEIIRTLSRERMQTVLCAGSGISQEPYVLSVAGFDVTALDSSSFALEFASELASGANQTSDPKVKYVVGDLLDTEICPGPFDMIIERRTLQLFSEHERGIALDALLYRLAPEGILLSHCHDARWRPPAEPKHFTKALLLKRGLTIWSGDTSLKPSGQVAWIKSSTG